MLNYEIIKKYEIKKYIFHIINYIYLGNIMFYIKILYQFHKYKYKIF